MRKLYILPLGVLFLTVSCTKQIDQGAKEYLLGKWQFNREAKDPGYLDHMKEGDDFFIAVSEKTLIVTYVNDNKVKTDSTEIGSILIGHKGIIEMRREGRSRSKPPTWVFQRIDADHMNVGTYDFGAPMRRMKPDEVIPSNSK